MVIFDRLFVIVFVVAVFNRETARTLHCGLHVCSFHVCSVFGPDTRTARPRSPCHSTVTDLAALCRLNSAYPQYGCRVAFDVLQG